MGSCSSGLSPAPACIAERRPRGQRQPLDLLGACAHIHPVSLLFSRFPSSPRAADPNAASAAIVTDSPCRRGKIRVSSSENVSTCHLVIFGICYSSVWFRRCRRRNLSASVLALSGASRHCPGCGSQRLLRYRSHPAGRGPNSSSLFPPLAAVVAVAPRGGASGVPVSFRLNKQSTMSREQECSAV